MDEVYVCDADALINLWRHFEKEALKALRHLAKHGFLKIPEGVCREILRGSDKLKRFVESKSASVEFRIEGSLQGVVAELDQKYGEQIRLGKRGYEGFWKSKAGRKAADAQVIAVAKHLSAICVSDDRGVRLACMLEDVYCIGWTEWARRILPAFQPSLFGDTP
jgi:predicted DNA-binding protein (UPF0278 family)